MHKIAQMSIFLIIIVTAILGGIILFASSRTEQKSGQLQSLSDPNYLAVEQFVQNCFDMVSVDAITTVSLQGGYYRVPNPFVSIFNVSVRTYWDKDTDNLPSLATIEKEISSFVEDGILRCIDDFKEFSNQGLAVKSTGPAVRTSISEGVDIILQYPLEYERSGTKFSQKDFRFSAKYPLKKAYESAILISLAQEKNPNAYPLGLISSLAKENNFHVETLSIDTNSLVTAMLFSLEDNQSEYAYAFGSVYAWEGGKDAK